MIAQLYCQLSGTRHPSRKQDFSLQGFGGEGCRIPWQEKEYPCIKALAGTGVEVGLYSAYV